MIYQVMHDLRNVEVGLVFATDGRVAAYDLCFCGMTEGSSS